MTSFDKSYSQEYITNENLQYVINCKNFEVINIVKMDIDQNNVIDILNILDINNICKSNNETFNITLDKSIGKYSLKLNIIN
jgi:hypothetical protein